MRVPTERDYPEDFHQENGQYWNRCLSCELEFVGNKHRRRCKECAIRIPKLTDKPA